MTQKGTMTELSTNHDLIDDDCFEKVKLNKLNNWKTNVYEEIPYNNQKLIHVK